ncbi:hypothetical protein CDL12_04357 [Handroanthus impetiginosus]|uniref:DUF4228 domain-containing protein n=1 Tax=Handroanthus impetiginosus TaxID=429701 RepID=A0A2G9HZZ8_9LAMI|nr:hypothetical protein CDL12_04357 [Handroanthus impetiginosus]
MGNLFHLSVLKSPCIKLSISKSRKVLQIVKMDGKIIEFKSPILVKEMLINFEGFVVTSSREAPKQLPPTCKLQLGKIYYLLPSKADEPNKLEGGASTRDETEPNGTSVKRIKVVITKKQLEELLTKKTSVEKIILGIDKACLANSAANWKPSLGAIPEENELIADNLAL